MFCMLFVTTPAIIESGTHDSKRFLDEHEAREGARLRGMLGRVGHHPQDLCDLSLGEADVIAIHIGRSCRSRVRTRYPLVAGSRDTPRCSARCTPPALGRAKPRADSPSPTAVR